MELQEIICLIGKRGVGEEEEKDMLQ